jgi:hypothetical protein
MVKITINDTKDSTWGATTNLKEFEKAISSNTRSLTQQEIDRMLGDDERGRDSESHS